MAPCAALIDAADLGAAAALGGPAIVKTARLGYDGKGQRSVNDAAGVEPAWEELGRVPCIVERRLPLDLEISVVLARRGDGVIATYPVAENVHRDGILDLTVVPARVDRRLADEARSWPPHIAEALDYVGVLAVELFVTERTPRSSTSWRRGPTTAATGPSTRRRRASSPNRSGRSPGPPSARHG